MIRLRMLVRSLPALPAVIVQDDLLKPNGKQWHVLQYGVSEDARKDGKTQCKLQWSANNMSFNSSGLSHAAVREAHDYPSLWLMFPWEWVTTPAAWTNKELGIASPRNRLVGGGSLRRVQLSAEQLLFSVPCNKIFEETVLLPSKTFYRTLATIQWNTVT